MQEEGHLFPVQEKRRKLNMLLEDKFGIRLIVVSL